MAKKVITFTGPEGRRWLRFGRLNQREFEAVRVRVERLVSARLAGEPPDRETATWLAGVSDYVRDALARVGLAEPRKRSNLGEWIAAHMLTRTDLKASSVAVYKRCERRLLEHFEAKGPRAIRSITPADAATWRRWLAAKERTLKDGTVRTMEENTVRKMTGVARQFFAAMIDDRIIEENPFEGLPATVRENEGRFYFVPAADSLKILDTCPDVEWKLIWALLRWGGLRCPSEIRALRLDGIDWLNERLTVWSPKTEHHEGRECRIIPIFPEIRPWLEAAYEAAPDGAVYVISRRRALRNHLETIIRRAGLVPWPKLFQNCRSTRETELVRTFPLHVVTKWIGHTPDVAKRHYLQVTDEDFKKATAPQEAPRPTPGDKGTERPVSENQ